VSDPEVDLVSGGLLDPALVAEAASHVDPQDFKDPKLRTVWSAIVGLVDAGATPDQVDPLSVAAQCATNSATRRKVAVFIGGLLDGTPRFTSLVESARRVRRAATLRDALRRMRIVGEHLKVAIDTPAGDVEDLESKLSDLAVAVAERGDKESQRRTYQDVATEVSAALDRIASGPSPEDIRTGIYRLDQRLGGGLRPGQLHTLVGGTGSGKTAFASQVADYATYAGKRAVMFSMEMDPVDIYLRDVERVAGRSRWDLRAQQAVTRENSAADLLKAQSEIVSRPGKVVYGDQMSVEGVRQTVLTERLRGGPVHLVVLDHAQVVAPSSRERRQMPRYLEIKNTAEAMRRMARSLNVAVLMTAQMNPPPKGEKPTMYLARESKDLINPSDVVMVLWHERDEVQEGDVAITETWLLAEKIRAGSPGKVRLKFDGKTFSFGDYSEQHGD